MRLAGEHCLPVVVRLIAGSGVQGRNPLPWGPGPRRPRESGVKKPPRRGLYFSCVPGTGKIPVGTLRSYFSEHGRERRRRIPDRYVRCKG